MCFPSLRGPIADCFVEKTEIDLNHLIFFTRIVHEADDSAFFVDQAEELDQRIRSESETNSRQFIREEANEMLRSVYLIIISMSLKNCPTNMQSRVVLVLFLRFIFSRSD